MNQKWNNLDLNALEDFRLVANHGGFGKASRATGRPKATLSRRVSDLEESMGLRLIERGGHTVKLTESGQLLLSRSDGLLNDLFEAIVDIREGTTIPRGRLRIAAPLLFSQVALGHLVAKFQAIYPEVQIEVIAEDRSVNLVDEHFNVAVRINPQKDSLLVGRCFAKDRLVLAAAPSLKKPQNIRGQSLKVPAVVMPTYREGELWNVQNNRLTIEPQPVLKLSSLLMIRDAVAEGAGVAMLPESLISRQLEKSELVSWGTDDKEVELWILHTSRRLQSLKVKAFVEFICKQYEDGSFTLKDS